MSDNEQDENQQNPPEGGEENQEEAQEKKLANLNEELIEEIEEIFEMFDKDRDQLISFFDLGNMLRWLKFNPTGRELKAYEDQYDVSKSGLVNIRQVKEIVNKKMMEPDSIEELIEAMKVLDTNNDGTIAVPELRWAMT